MRRSTIVAALAALWTALGCGGTEPIASPPTGFIQRGDDLTPSCPAAGELSRCQHVAEPHCIRRRSACCPGRPIRPVS